MIPWHGLIPYFNPLPRKEGDIVHLNDAWNNRGHFNPLPRKEGDGVLLINAMTAADISIHSLVKRETRSCRSCPLCVLISIHSLVKRETLYCFTRSCIRSISIHSLVKRETVRPFFTMTLLENFNPLPRKEGDQRLLLCTGV